MSEPREPGGAAGPEERPAPRAKPSQERSRGPLQPVGMERDEREMRIAWSDGHTSLHAYDDLRRACPCATCRTEREKRASASPLRVLPAHTAAHAELVGIQWVGRYGFRLAWADGHDTGIYAFDYLRSLCACPACATPPRLQGTEPGRTPPTT